MSGYPDSYYVATAKGVEERPRLEESLQADVCVIGGGFTGLTAALNLAEQGLDVVLLEAERIGFGASGRCGGLIGSGQRKDVIETEKQFGLERSRLLWDFAELAKQDIRDRVANHDIDCDLQYGQVEGIHKKGYVGWPQELAEVLAERYDYPHCKALSRDETREYVNTWDFLEGFWDAQAMAIHPLNYSLGLARAASEAGCASIRKFASHEILANGSCGDRDRTRQGDSVIYRARVQRLSRQAGTTDGRQDNADQQFHDCDRAARRRTCALGDQWTFRRARYTLCRKLFPNVG